MHFLYRSLDRWHRRQRGTLAKVGVASLAGAITSILAGFEHRRSFAKGHWEILGFVGLTIGGIGGLFLANIENHKALHGTEPAYLIWGRRILITFAILAASVLVPLFIYLMWLVATT